MFWLHTVHTRSQPLLADESESGEVCVPKKRQSWLQSVLGRRRGAEAEVRKGWKRGETWETSTRVKVGVNVGASGKGVDESGLPRAQRGEGDEATGGSDPPRVQRCRARKGRVEQAADEATVRERVFYGAGWPDQSSARQESPRELAAVRRAGPLRQ